MGLEGFLGWYLNMHFPLKKSLIGWWLASGRGLLNSQKSRGAISAFNRAISRNIFPQGSWPAARVWQLSNPPPPPHPRAQMLDIDALGFKEMPESKQMVGFFLGCNPPKQIGLLVTHTWYLIWSENRHPPPSPWGMGGTLIDRSLIVRN